MRLKRPKIITPTLDKGVIKEMFVVTKSRFHVLMWPDDLHCRSDTQLNTTLGNYAKTIGDPPKNGGPLSLSGRQPTRLFQ